MSETDDIKLNTDVLNANGETYVSVTDLYNVNIFTDKDMQDFKLRKEMQETYYNKISQNVFEMNGKENDTLVLSNLFMDTMTISKKQEIAGDSDAADGWILAAGLLVLAIFVLSMVHYNIYRSIRRKKDADSNNLYQ